MWISVLWHSRFHCPGIVLLGTQKYDIEAYTGTILNFFQYFAVSNFILSNIYINDDLTITIPFHDVIGSVSKYSERSLADINKSKV